MTELQKHLERLGACKAAKSWASDKTAKQTWDECTRVDWLLWWAARTPKNNKQDIVRCAARFARLALRFVPDGENRPLKAIEAAEKWVENPTEENAARAARAADAAAYAADAAYAAYAADAAYAAARAADAAARAAARAAYAAARAADAPDAAYAAARADAAYAAARAAFDTCSIVREELKQPWSEGD